MNDLTLQEHLDTLFGIRILDNLTNGLDMTSEQGLRSYLVRRMRENVRLLRLQRYVWNLELWDSITIWNSKIKEFTSLPTDLLATVIFTTAGLTIWEAYGFAEIIQRKLDKGFSKAKGKNLIQYSTLEQKIRKNQ